MCQDLEELSLSSGARVPDKNLRLRAAAPMTERINTQRPVKAVDDLSGPNNVTNVSD